MAIPNRKFLLGAYVVVAGTVLAAFARLTAEFVTLALGIYTAFSGADTIITHKALKTGAQDAAEELAGKGGSDG